MCENPFKKGNFSVVKLFHTAPTNTNVIKNAHKNNSLSAYILN